jgi:hypothetical protein
VRWCYTAADKIGAANYSENNEDFVMFVRTCSCLIMLLIINQTVSCNITPVARQVEVRNHAILWGVLNGFEKSLAHLIFSMTWRREDVEIELARTIALTNLTLSPINTEFLSTLLCLFYRWPNGRPAPSTTLALYDMALLQLNHVVLCHATVSKSRPKHDTRASLAVSCYANGHGNPPC